MKSHRETCIVRLAELADDVELRAGIIWALTKGCTTQHLSLTIQATLELRDAIVDERDKMNKLDDAARRILGD